MVQVKRGARKRFGACLACGQSVNCPHGKNCTAFHWCERCTIHLLAILKADKVPVGEFMKHGTCKCCADKLAARVRQRIIDEVAANETR